MLARGLGRAVLVVLSVTSCAVLAGCADPAHGGQSPTAAQGADPRGTAQDVVIAVAGEPDTLDPVLGYARWGDGKITEGLVRLTADLDVEPLLATSGLVTVQDPATGGESPGVV